MRSHSREETCGLAHDFLENLTPEKDGATVVALNGTLGAGKTTFVQCVAEELEVEGTVTSPTFLLERIYPVHHNTFRHLVHIDTYRLEDEEEMTTVGWQDLVDDPKALIFVEWAEKIPSFLPKRHHTISFEFIDETTREITISYASEKTEK